jgi:hypothetical protein
MSGERKNEGKKGVCDALTEIEGRDILWRNYF